MNFVDKDGTTKVYIPDHPWFACPDNICSVLWLSVQCTVRYRQCTWEYHQYCGGCSLHAQNDIISEKEVDLL